MHLTSLRGVFGKAMRTLRACSIRALWNPPDWILPLWHSMAFRR